VNARSDAGMRGLNGFPGDGMSLGRGIHGHYLVHPWNGRNSHYGTTRGIMVQVVVDMEMIFRIGTTRVAIRHRFLWRVENCRIISRL
jgi:hypothetical protein